MEKGMFRTLTLRPEPHIPDPPIAFEPVRFTRMDATSNVATCARIVHEAGMRKCKRAMVT